MPFGSPSPYPQQRAPRDEPRSLGFAHLHVHSEYSFLAGVPRIEQLVDRAREWGMPALALTDRNRVSGLIRFHTACKRAGVHGVLGVEWDDPRDAERRVVGLARNLEGYGDLCEITTRRQLDPPPDFFGAIFSRPWPGLFLFTSTPELLRELARGPNRERLFGELVNTDARARARSRAVEQAAGEWGLPLVVTGDVWLLDRADWDLHRLLCAIDRNASLSSLRPGDTASPGAWFRGADDMTRLFPNHVEALRNSGRIAAACRVRFSYEEAEGETRKWILPRICVPEGHTPESTLAHLAGRGLEANYRGRENYARALDLQCMELEVIGKLGYASYFLMVRELREWAGRRFAGGYRRPRDCTILRGSAANSITFYNLGASDLDPLRHKLYFQRFLNEDRASPPDADIDFGWDERDEALRFMAERFGRDRVAVTGTTNRFRGRAGFREAAKVYGLSDGAISRILEARGTPARRICDGELEELWHWAALLEGRPRFLGQHPGGLLITNDPLCRHTALERSGGEKDRVITQIDMHNGIDELGLVKFDILGNGSLSVLRDTLDQIREQGLPDPGVGDVDKCAADPGVQAIIARGRTRGIFYIESPAQTRLNLKCAAGSFEEITITSSLVRPAGTAYAATFVERHRKHKLGIRDWEFLHPSLLPILGDTHDVFAFQEDVTRACHQVAGLSYKMADRLRKQMNSQHDGALEEAELRQLAGEFMRGCMRQSGLSREQALELWRRVASFTGFSFCKSHSASYARLSFQCTYLKSRFPAQFLAAVISNNHGFYHREVYLDEARRWGVRVLPLDLNRSGVKYRGRDRAIRPGLMHVRGLGGGTMARLMDERESGGPYGDLPDFLQRVRPHKSEVENLVLVGALDCLGLSQTELLFQLAGIYGKRAAPGPSLFDGFPAPRGELRPGLSDFTLLEKCLNQQRLLGYMLSADILDILELHPAAKDAVPAVELSRHLGRRVKVFGKRIACRVHQVSHTGEPMKFLTLGDKSDSVEVIFWPAVFERFADALAEPGPYEVWGRVTEDWGAYSLEAEGVRPARWDPNLVDFELASRRLAGSRSHYRTYAEIEEPRDVRAA